MTQAPKTNLLGSAKQGKIKQVFTDLNRKFEERDTERRARNLHLPYFNLAGYPIEQAVLAVVGKDQAEACEAIPFYKEGLLLRLGIANPDNPNLQSLLTDLEKKKYHLELFLISESSLVSAHKQYQKILKPTDAPRHEVSIGVGEEVLKKLYALPERGEVLTRIPPSELLNLIIGAAVNLRASDIHLEPERTVIKIRFRIDGVLQDIILLPLTLEHMLMSRIKLLAGMKINISTIPQDGRFTVKLPDRNLDLRISVLSSAHGETVAMRILGIQEVGLDIEQLGLGGLGLKAVYRELRKTNGMIITTGPTGSGKTTSLYSFLNYLNRPGIKIITIEDPVEYQLEGIIQTPIDRSAGVDFAKALLSVLRQDPDILMVGEIRDFETAETACQAALTGHVVFSSMHTNDASGAVPRFLDLGIKPVILAPALNAIIAQRLLRRICQSCREVYKPAYNELQRVKLILSQLPEVSKVEIPDRLIFYHSKGCAECHNLGYKGRVGIFEVFAVDEKIEALIFKQASATEIKKAAILQGMVTMQQDGILKAIEGITDLLEVWRVTEE